METTQTNNAITANSDLLQHPLSAAFPAMQDNYFQLLKDSIENIGVQNPIVLFEGKIIDGWHRYCAAQETRTPCPCADLADDVDPKDFVIAQNERRRHLTASQIADAVVRVFDWLPVGRPNSQPGCELNKTTAELAKIASVSTETIRHAKFVQTNAEPGIQAAVKSGKISLKAAAAVAKLPPEDQKKVAASGPAAIKKAAKPTQAPVVDTKGQSELEELREQIAEMAVSLKEAIADNESMGRVFDADDKLAAATAEIKRLTALVGVIETRLTGQTNELNEAKHLAQQWKRRAERAEAALPKEAA